MFSVTTSSGKPFHATQIKHKFCELYVCHLTSFFRLSNVDVIQLAVGAVNQSGEEYLDKIKLKEINKIFLRVACNYAIILISKIYPYFERQCLALIFDMRPCFILNQACVTFFFTGRPKYKMLNLAAGCLKINVGS